MATVFQTPFKAPVLCYLLKITLWGRHCSHFHLLLGNWGIKRHRGTCLRLQSRLWSWDLNQTRYKVGTFSCSPIFKKYFHTLCKLELLLNGFYLFTWRYYLLDVYKVLEWILSIFSVRSYLILLVFNYHHPIYQIKKLKFRKCKQFAQSGSHFE